MQGHELCTVTCVALHVCYRREQLTSPCVMAQSQTTWALFFFLCSVSSAQPDASGASLASYHNRINFRRVLNFAVFADAGRTAKLSPSGLLIINNRPRTRLSTCTNNGTLKILGKTRQLALPP